MATAVPGRLVKPGLRVITCPNDQFDGYRYGAFFHLGRAEVSDAETVRALLALGYTDITDEPEGEE